MIFLHINLCKIRCYKLIYSFTKYIRNRFTQKTVYEMLHLDPRGNIKDLQSYLRDILKKIARNKFRVTRYKGRENLNKPLILRHLKVTAINSNNLFETTFNQSTSFACNCKKRYIVFGTFYLSLR